MERTNYKLIRGMGSQNSQQVLVARFAALGDAVAAQQMFNKLHDQACVWHYVTDNRGKRVIG